MPSEHESGLPRAERERIERARDEVGRTAVTPRVARALVAAFVFALALPHLAQLSLDPRFYRGTGGRPAAAPGPGAAPTGAIDRVLAANRALLARAQALEDRLADESVVGHYVRPLVQRAMTGWLGAGTAQVEVGSGGWLYFRPDIDHVTGRGFLSPHHLARRADEGDTLAPPSHPDPRPALLTLGDALRRRGVRLVVMPTPVKPSVEAAGLGAARLRARSVLSPVLSSEREAAGLGAARLGAPIVTNRSYPRFVAELEAAGVAVFDVAATLAAMRREGEGPLYLATDTHWRPGTVRRVAADLAAFVEGGAALSEGGAALSEGRAALSEDEAAPSEGRAALSEGGPALSEGGAAPSGRGALSGPGALSGRGDYRLRPVEVTNAGDTARLLGLGPAAARFPPETVRVERVETAEGEPWAPARGAEVLLLGDSFTNVYSLGALGWGTSAGLAEHLSFALGRPVDRLAQNDDGASASRRLLSAELARDPDRLAATRVVIYQFAARELSQGDWRPVDLDAAAAPPAAEDRFWSAEEGVRATVEATVRAIGPVPRPGSVPYRDHVVAILLNEIEVLAGSVVARGREAVVYARSMADNELTPAAALRPGDRVRLALEPWSRVAGELDGISRGELDDPRLLTVLPWWGTPTGAGAP